MTNFDIESNGLMNERLWNRTLLITALLVTIVSAASVWAAWAASPNLASRLSLAALAPIFGAAFVSYALRIVRFYYFLTRSGVPISFRDTILVQMMGFAFSVTPGRVGEVFKLHMIRERVGTPVIQTTPLLLLDRLTEGGGFMILAIITALLLPTLQSNLPMPALILIGLSAIFVFALTRNYWRPVLVAVNTRLLKLKMWQRVVPHAENLWRGLETTFTPPQILGGLALSTVARFADGIVVYFAAQMLGVQLAIPTAVFTLAVSGLAGGISFLPAGTGAVETTMVGLFVLMGTRLSRALSIALVTRMFTLWIWVALGLVMIFILRLLPHWIRVGANGES